MAVKLVWFPDGPLSSQQEMLVFQILQRCNSSVNFYLICRFTGFHLCGDVPPKNSGPSQWKPKIKFALSTGFPRVPNGSTESFRKQKSINAKHELIFSTPRKGAPSPSTPHSKVTPRKMWWFPWWPGPAKLHCLFGQRAAWKKKKLEQQHSSCGRRSGR